MSTCYVTTILAIPAADVVKGAVQRSDNMKTVVWNVSATFAEAASELATVRQQDWRAFLLTADDLVVIDAAINVHDGDVNTVSKELGLSQWVLGGSIPTMQEDTTTTLKRFVHNELERGYAMLDKMGVPEVKGHGEVQYRTIAQEIARLDLVDLLVKMTGVLGYMGPDPDAFTFEKELRLLQFQYADREHAWTAAEHGIPIDEFRAFYPTDTKLVSQAVEVVIEDEDEEITN